MLGGRAIRDKDCIHRGNTANSKGYGYISMEIFITKLRGKNSHLSQADANHWI